PRLYRGAGRSRWDGWCLCRLLHRTPAPLVSVPRYLGGPSVGRQAQNQRPHPAATTPAHAHRPHRQHPPNDAQPQATTRPPHAEADVRRPARISARFRAEPEACAHLAARPVRHAQAAGIDVGDASHWVCVEATPDGSDPVREFPAHTPGLRQLVAWLKLCAVTTIALEATGVYGHVLYLTLLEP